MSEQPEENSNLSVQVNELAMRQAKTLDKLGDFDKPLSIALPIIAWLALFFAFGFRWWTAALLAVLVAVLVIVVSIIIAGLFTSKYAKQFVNTWPPQDVEHILALDALSQVEDVQLKDELMRKIQTIAARSMASG